MLPSSPSADLFSKSLKKPGITTIPGFFASSALPLLQSGDHDISLTRGGDEAIRSALLKNENASALKSGFLHMRSADGILKTIKAVSKPEHLFRFVEKKTGDYDKFSMEAVLRK